MGFNVVAMKERCKIEILLPYFGSHLSVLRILLYVVEQSDSTNHKLPIIDPCVREN